MAGGRLRPPASADAFAALWDSYASAIYSYCFRRTADMALAEDLASVVFLEAWRRRAQVALAPEKELPWLYGIATNVLRNQRRSQRRYAAALRRFPRPRPEPDVADAAAERLDHEASMREVLAHVADLSALEQEVLALCVWQGVSTSDAAQALDVPEATVRTRLHRAREHLRALISSADTPASSAIPSPHEQGAHFS